VQGLSEPSGLVHPAFADRFVGRQTAERLEAAGEVVGGHEVGEVLPKLIGAVVVEAFDGGLLDRAVHPLNLTIRPGMARRMARLRETVLDVEVGAGTLEGVAAEQHLPGGLALISSGVQVLPVRSISPSRSACTAHVRGKVQRPSAYGRLSPAPIRSGRLRMPSHGNLPSCRAQLERQGYSCQRARPTKRSMSHHTSRLDNRIALLLMREDAFGHQKSDFGR
jgi:hypothetical protein